ncbi:Peroxiredoxin [Psychroflexus salarius]|uniref:Peroxiredoxin n=1 Tax=Psychroflexus salarius TaxID=1155689 RepID=A0A1M4XAY0_9FLAO|nr:thioredoxin family protein [Psychroflexus salarius]SHE90657.1 Peroxiredoxin [Psychroflexus salarius]
MALTESNPIEIGFKAPDFTLQDSVSNEVFELYKDLRGEKGTVIMFICNHCPYVVHVIEELVRIANDYRVTGFSFVAISSNDILKYPQDSPQKMYEFAREHDFPFPYLYDETQLIAKAYQAMCTPDIYVFDRDLKLNYHGQIDDSRPQNNIPISGTSLRQALDFILSNKSPIKTQKPAMGCGIKWK